MQGRLSPTSDVREYDQIPCETPPWVCIGKAKLIVTVEEHNIYGGLGSAVAEHLSIIESSPKQLFHGISDKYTKEGDYNSLKNKHGLIATKIMNRILKNYDK